MDTLRHVWFRFVGIGADAADDQELRTRKRLLVAITLLIDVPTSLFQGLFYLLNQERSTALLHFVWAAASFGNLAYFGLRRTNFRAAAVRALLLCLAMPLAMTVSLGGIVNSGAYLIMTLLAPIGVAVFLGTRAIPFWSAAQCCVVALGAALDCALNPNATALQRANVISFVANIAIVSVILEIGFSYFINQREQALLLLRREQEKSEALLRNILPAEVAALLKNDTRTIADRFDSVTILFADIVGFTAMASRMEPEEIVALLNEVFSAFDTMVERHGLEKIKTIGDCYMVAAGVPSPRPDHAHVMARLALEMHEYVSLRRFRGVGRLCFRIGLNSGSVSAGVIGSRKFSYDLWGDAVNTASRMEAHGMGGETQLTRSTFELIRDEYLCTPGGCIPIKGKGDMEVWRLMGRGADVPRGLPTPEPPRVPDRWREPERRVQVARNVPVSTAPVQGIRATTANPLTP